jgi:cytoskeleton protein RodZ
MERERHRLTLSSVATELRITQQYLEAMEDDNIEALPGAFFYKSFVRQYARHLGLDASEFEQELAALCQTPQTRHEGNTVAAAAIGVSGTRSTNPPPAEPDAGMIVKVLSFFREASDRVFSPSLGQRSSGGFAAILVLATAGVAGWIELPKLSESVRASSPASDSNSRVSKPSFRDETSGVPPAPEPPAEATVSETLADTPAVIAEAKVPTPEPTLAAAPTRPSAVSGSNLKLTATEPTWLAVSEQGRVLFAGVLRTGESKTFADLHNATLRLGNAGGIEAEWNGQSTGSLGHHGDVRTIRFTAEGFRAFEPGGKL